LESIWRSDFEEILFHYWGISYSLKTHNHCKANMNQVKWADERYKLSVIYTPFSESFFLYVCNAFRASSEISEDSGAAHVGRERSCPSWWFARVIGWVGVKTYSVVSHMSRPFLFTRQVAPAPLSLIRAIQRLNPELTCTWTPQKMVSYTIQAPAYFKIFFHAAKHPHKQVNGVLLGASTPSGVEIRDAVPLLHHWTSLSPMMEIGLEMVSTTPLANVLHATRPAFERGGQGLSNLVIAS